MSLDKCTGAKIAIDGFDHVAVFALVLTLLDLWLFLKVLCNVQIVIDPPNSRVNETVLNVSHFCEMMFHFMHFRNLEYWDI